MARIKKVYVRSREDGKIKIGGYATGLEEGWNYCFFYRYMDGPMENVGNAGTDYTFVKLDDYSRKTSRTRLYDFGESGTYVGDEGNGVYTLYLYLVGHSCDEKLHLESEMSFPVEEESPTPPPTTCTEGTYSADRAMVCRGGKWVPVSTPPAPGPEVPGPAPGPEVPGPSPGVPAMYLTPEQAASRSAMGLPCYVKCTLPVLNMLPGIPYTPGAWIPPFCAITEKP